MRSEYTYEWVAELVNADGDIIDPQFFPGTTEGCIDALRVRECEVHSDEVVRVDVALVMSYGNDERGIVERGWAYLSPNGWLPEKFTSGQRLNFRYFRQLDAARAAVFHNPKREG